MTSQDGISPRLQSNHQEAYYDEHVDYRYGSPHLSHPWLYDRLVGVVRGCLRDLAAAGLPLRVLEIGSGHGGYTEPVLAAGCDVTAVEASQPAVEELQRRYGTNPRFRALLDRDGTLAGIDEAYSMVLIVSVLHHIPDYLSFLDNVSSHLSPGGVLLTLQDPLWYARLAPGTHALDKGGYFVWRARQGNVRRALATQSRRLRGIYDTENPADMVEYHIVRDGVDEEQIADRITPMFDRFEILPYWSHQSRVIQRLGERLHRLNTFGVLAAGYRPPPPPPR